MVVHIKEINISREAGKEDKSHRQDTEMKPPWNMKSWRLGVTQSALRV